MLLSKWIEDYDSKQPRSINSNRIVNIDRKELWFLQKKV